MLFEKLTVLWKPVLQEALSEVVAQSHQGLSDGEPFFSAHWASRPRLRSSTRKV